MKCNEHPLSILAHAPAEHLKRFAETLRPKVGAIDVIQYGNRFAKTPNGPIVQVAPITEDGAIMVEARLSERSGCRRLRRADGPRHRVRAGPGRDRCRVSVRYRPGGHGQIPAFGSSHADLSIHASARGQHANARSPGPSPSRRSMPDGPKPPHRKPASPVRGSGQRSCRHVLRPDKGDLTVRLHYL